ncbi:hypothetical protein M404DRAFT_1007139 [Pisolithus tinctorius Marx 270]|uniref:Uncharacterized protein n=1 Tax=Pisolithus tinctorius Marx 270 TaxID=870435 RepID=A0A0C3NKR0_PISTI|nr:hypothetical protein M404DRAFT_1007139 [Pisolithus tinctorius Marx 270]
MSFIAMCVEIMSGCFAIKTSHIHAAMPRLSRICLTVCVSRILRPHRTAHFPCS